MPQRRSGSKPTMYVNQLANKSQIMKIEVENSNPVCVYCGLDFNFNSELAAHIMVTHFGDVFHCDVCDAICYETKEEFCTHIESHLRANSLGSEDSLPFLDEVNGRFNMTSLRKKNTNCGSDFTWQHYLSQHVASHHQKDKIRENTVQHYCDLCEQMFTRKCELNVHLKKKHHSKDSHNLHVKAEIGHTEPEQNQYTQLTQPCLVQIQNSETNKIDLLLILPASPWLNINNSDEISSPHCRTIKQEDSVSHLDEETTEFENSQLVVKGQLVYKCFLCQQHIKTRPEFIEHLRIHSGLKRSCLCRFCGKQFRSLSLLNNHNQDVHAKVKRFPCDFCGRKFTFLRTRDDHHRTHTGECPCICDVCGKAFKSKSSLYFHRRFHSNIFRYKCAYCEKRYHIRQQLKRHILSHTGSKPYPCDKCGKAFQFKSGLKKHKHNHENKEEIECQICGKSFSQLRYLKIHVRSHNLRSLNKLPS